MEEVGTKETEPEQTEVQVMKKPKWWQFRKKKKMRQNLGKLKLLNIILLV